MKYKKNMDDFKIDFGSLKVDQLGFVFKDIEKQAKIMEDIFGFSKFIFGDMNTNTIQFRGKDSKITSQLAFSRIGNTQIELIKWIDGECSYKEFLDQGRERLHHIAIYVDYTDSYIKEFEKNGINVLQAGVVFTTKLTYMDSEKKFGFIVELLERIKRRKQKE
jgi:4-hydroxyphenylpyruvate dioxygenase-like putative hemolysin